MEFKKVATFRSVGLLKFGLLEVTIVSLISLLTSLIAVFIFDHTHSKFDLWGNLILRVTFSIASVCFISLLIVAVLIISRQFLVRFKVALIFALVLGIYLEVLKLSIDRYELAHGPFAELLILNIGLPAVLGSIFFLQKKGDLKAP